MNKRHDAPSFGKVALTDRGQWRTPLRRARETLELASLLANLTPSGQVEVIKERPRLCPCPCPV
jgi:hypothetical protein